MGWFADILRGLQSTNPTEMTHILPTKDMPYFLENPNYVENISNHLPTINFGLEKSKLHTDFDTLATEIRTIMNLNKASTMK